MREPEPTLTGPVEIVGAGLLGTSIGLACARAGVEVVLADASVEHLRTASGLGAGRPASASDRPQLVVVAVPPDALGGVIVQSLRERPDAVVTDVGSVKAGLPAEVERAAGPDAARRYVGGHPMAGSERSGPLAATPALFDGRPWAITPHADSDPAAVRLVAALAQRCGAVPVSLSPEEHDKAVARTSHVPHLLAALVAGRLADAPEQHLALSGQGVRDVTRVAAGSPALYGQIVSANAQAVLGLLAEVRAQLDAVIDAVAADDRPALRPCWRAAWPAPGRSRASTASRCGRCGRCSSRCPTTPASSRGCSPTRAPAASTSRTSTSTTTRAGRSVSSSSSSTRRAPSTC